MKSRVCARIGANDDGEVISIPGGRGVTVAPILIDSVGVLARGIVDAIVRIVGDTATVGISLYDSGRRPDSCTNRPNDCRTQYVRCGLAGNDGNNER